ncbi:MAG: hypothetical protein ACOC5T_10270 [Elusimicrobiota bacterium]
MSVALSALNTVMDVFKYGWPFMILMFVIIAKVRGKNWPVEAVIIEKRGKNLIKTKDRAGKYKDKFTGLVGYKMKKSGDKIPVVDYEWVMHNTDPPTGLLDRISKFFMPTIGTIFLYRYGSMQYKPIKPNYNENAKTEWEMIKDSEGKPIAIQKYQQFDPRGYLEAVELEVQDWDNINFMVQEMRSSEERRKKKDHWLKAVLVPLGIIAAAAIVSIVMMKFALDYSQTLKSSGALNTQPENTEIPDIPIVGDAFNPDK